MEETCAFKKIINDLCGHTIVRKQPNYDKHTPYDSNSYHAKEIHPMQYIIHLGNPNSPQALQNSPRKYKFTPRTIKFTLGIAKFT